MTKVVDAVVLGAGPAGLGAALALARAGARVCVVDPASEVGGLCVTRRRDGLAYDVGGHIPFVRDDARRDWLADLLGDDLVWVDRPVACVREGRVTRGRYLDQRPVAAPADRASRDGSAAGELGARFGAGFVDVAMRPYLEKVDGVALERIPAERALKLMIDQAAPDGFHFPAHGIGQLMDTMAGAAEEAGAEIRLRTAARAIAARGGRAAGVTLADGSRVGADAVVVAMPAGIAAGLLDPPPAAAANGGVRMRAVAIVYLELPRERLTEEPWVQVDDPRVPFARAFEPRNWSAALCPPGRTVLGLECYCQADATDPVWGLADADLAAACARALSEPLGLLDDPGPARLVEVLRLPRAYPLPDAGQAEALRRPLDALDAVAGIHRAPGAAVIEAIEGGERAAAAILAGDYSSR